MHIDLTHPFTNEMPAYPGDSRPSLRQSASIGKDGYADHELKTTMHIGTHIDAPAHMVKRGKRIDELPLELFYGRGAVVDARGRKDLDIEILKNCEIKEGQIVLFYTGFSKKYRTPEYFTGYPSMTEVLARELVKKKIKMVGVDSPSPDKKPYLIHKILLGAEILIIENLTNLESLLKIKAFDVEAIPMRIAADAAFARIMAIVK